VLAAADVDVQAFFGVWLLAVAYLVLRPVAAAFRVKRLLFAVYAARRCGIR
jgi:hypothetical protein